MINLSWRRGFVGRGYIVCTSSDLALFLCLSSGQFSEFSLIEDEGKRERERGEEDSK